MDVVGVVVLLDLRRWFRGRMLQGVKMHILSVCGAVNEQILHFF